MTAGASERPPRTIHCGQLVHESVHEPIHEHALHCAHGVDVTIAPSEQLPDRQDRPSPRREAAAAARA